MIYLLAVNDILKTRSFALTCIPSLKCKAYSGSLQWPESK